MSISTVSDTDAREEPARVLASSVFAASDRRRRFLSQVADEGPAGGGDRVKGYTIATAALDRGDDFDPQPDTIVRIEAGSLRRALDHNRLTEGGQNPLRALVPIASYVRASLPPRLRRFAARGLGANRRGPRIFVAPFEMEVGSDALPDLGRGNTRQVTRFSNP